MISNELKPIHALDRLALGPRPGDIDRVTEMGVERWIAPPEGEWEPHGADHHPGRVV
ncbi:MAG: hypothetical protein HY217_06765 [Candidatus Rokubacteria bacterium]|nr:hypothetical protein [Candidatus Rokubacteria bacterium]